MRKIIMEFDEKTGNITMKTTGFNGKECFKETDFLKKALGTAVKEIKTSEFYKTSNISKYQVKQKNKGK